MSYSGTYGKAGHRYWYGVYDQVQIVDNDPAGVWIDRNPTGGYWHQAADGSPEWVSTLTQYGTDKPLGERYTRLLFGLYLSEDVKARFRAGRYVRIENTHYTRDGREYIVGGFEVPKPEPATWVDSPE